MTRSLYLLALPLLTLAACAPAVPKDGSAGLAETGRRCAFSEMISGYTVDKDTLYLRSGNNVYQVDSTGFCPDLDNGIALGFRSPLGTSQICVGDWIDVIPPANSVASMPCRAKVTKFMTPADLEAMPKKLRP